MWQTTGRSNTAGLRQGQVGNRQRSGRSAPATNLSKANSNATLRSSAARIAQLVRWNEGHSYTFDRETLIKMLDDALVNARPRTEWARSQLVRDARWCPDRISTSYELLAERHTREHPRDRRTAHLHVRDPEEQQQIFVAVAIDVFTHTPDTRLCENSTLNNGKPHGTDLFKMHGSPRSAA